MVGFIIIAILFKYQITKPKIYAVLAIVLASVITLASVYFSASKIELSYTISSIYERHLVGSCMRNIASNAYMHFAKKTDVSLSDVQDCVQALVNNPDENLRDSFKDLQDTYQKYRVDIQTIYPSYDPESSALPFKHQPLPRHYIIYKNSKGEINLIFYDTYANPCNTRLGSPICKAKN